MKDIDKLFSDKLYNHKTPPPANLWDQMDGALEAEQRQKRKVLWWRVAAAVTFILMTSGLLWLQMDQDKTEIVAETTNQAPELPMEQPEIDSEKIAPMAQATEPADTEPRNQPKQIKEQTLESLKSDNTTGSTQKEAGKETVPQLAEGRSVKDGNDQSELPEIKPLSPEPVQLESQRLALLETEVAQSPSTVTVIYKPGQKTQGRVKQQDLNKPIELLSDLKNNKISFSEIRSAKSDLLAKVFNKIDNEFSR